MNKWKDDTNKINNQPLDARDSNFFSFDRVRNNDKEGALANVNHSGIYDFSVDESDDEKIREKAQIKNRRMILGLVFGSMFIICLITVILIKMKYDYDIENLQEQEYVQNEYVVDAEMNAKNGQNKEINGYEDGFYIKDVYDENDNFLYRSKYRYLSLIPPDENLSYYGKDTGIVVSDDNEVINTYYDHGGRISREVTAKGEIRQFTYNEDGYLKSAEYTYPDGSVEKQNYDDFGNRLSSRIDYADGSYRLAQYNRNGNRYATTYNSSDAITGIDYYYEPFNEIWDFDEKGVKPVAFRFYDDIDTFSVNLAGDGKVTRETLKDGSTVTTFTDSELTYRLTEKTDGNQKREISDKEGTCLFTIYLWNTKDVCIVTKYYDPKSEEAWAYNNNSWMVHFEGAYMLYDYAVSNHTEEYVSFNEEEEYVEVVSVDSVIAKTGSDSRRVRRYYSNGVDNYEIIDGIRVNEKWETTHSSERIRNYSFQGNDKYDDKAIFRCFED